MHYTEGLVFQTWVWKETTRAKWADVLTNAKVLNFENETPKLSYLLKSGKEIEVGFGQISS